MSSNCIDLGEVAKTFGGTRAVRDLNLQIPSGSLCGFLGPNGAGKSTTIRMIMSIIRPDRGSLRVLGGDALDHKDRIGYLPEERGVYRKMKVADYLRYIGRLKGVDAASLRKLITESLERIGLPGVEKKRCEELSKGMQQKVQFLAAIIHKPELIILDEPFSGLDPVNAMLLHDLIRELHDEGRTILFSTHVLHQAERMCDRIVMIDQGSKVLDDELETIRERFDPRTIIAEPLGDPAELSSLLKNAPEVESIEIDDEGRVHARLRQDIDADRVMAAAIAGGPLRSIERARTTLDEVFLHLVNRPLQHGAADPAEAAHV
ncbi:MAG: ATP-binding cassette domain-containing protein [Phycisphaera sp. TMED9]|nr:MAG: ATP-binding cassette domain-containing protein [Phycisphaera sp. TMED9]